MALCARFDPDYMPAHEHLVKFDLVLVKHALVLLSAMSDGNFFANFTEMLRARVEGRRGPRLPQLAGPLYPDQTQHPSAHKTASSAPHTYKTIPDYIGIARRRWPLIAGTTALFTAVGVAVTWWVPTLYNAEAVVLLDMRNVQVSDIKAAVPARPFDVAMVRGEIEVLNSRTLAEKVVEKLHLTERPDFAGIGAPVQHSGDVAQRLQHAIGNLLGRLAVRNDGHSSVLKIDCTAATPQLAAEIANAYADVYLEHQIAAKNEATRHATEWLESQIAAVREQISDTEQRLSRYREEHGITSTRGTTVTAQELADINSQLITAHGDRVQKEAALRYAKQVLDSPSGAEVAGQVLASSLIQRLREQEADLLRRMAELSTRYRPAHPTMLRIAAEIDDLHRKLADEASRVVRAMGDEASAARTREETLKANLAELSRSVARQESTDIQLRELEREGDASRALYDSLLTRFKQTSAQQDLQQPDAQIVSRAEPAASRSVPDKRRLFIMSPFLSAVLGVLLTLFMEFVDSTFRHSDEIEELAGLPVLGMLPAIERQPSNDGKRKEADAILSEALRDIRSGLRQSLTGAPLGVMLVTSSAQDEGKTYFSVELGRSVVRAGLRCLVIDCHFQRPGLDKLLSPAPAKGMPVPAQYPQIQIDNNSALHYVPAPAPEQRRLFRSQDLFESVEMGNYIRRMRSHYHLIILDAPPVQAVVDLVALSRLADTAVFLVRWGRTPRQAALNALRVLTLRGVNLAGVVLSRVDLRRYASYGSGDYARYLQNVAASARSRP